MLVVGLRDSNKDRREKVMVRNHENLGEGMGKVGGRNLE